MGLSHKRGGKFLKYPLPGRGKFFICLNCLKITDPPLGINNEQSLNFIVTVELLNDQAGSDFVQCQTKMRAFASRICSELNKLNLIEIELFIKMFMKSGLLYDPTIKQTNLRAGCKSALQPGTMTGRRSETFEALLYLFSSEDKY